MSSNRKALRQRGASKLGRLLITSNVSVEMTHACFADEYLSSGCQQPLCKVLEWTGTSLQTLGAAASSPHHALIYIKWDAFDT